MTKKMQMEAYEDVSRFEQYFHNLYSILADLLRNAMRLGTDFRTWKKSKTV